VAAALSACAGPSGASRVAYAPPPLPGEAPRLYPGHPPSFLQVGTASWYGDHWKRRPTASGERFNPKALTAAHRSLPLQTVARVTNLNNGRIVLVRTHDDPGEFRDLPFAFVASGDPTLLSAPSLDPRDGPATLRLSSPPGAVATLAVRLRAGLRVRYLITMPDMSPQADAATPAAGGWYRGAIVPPMEG